MATTPPTTPLLHRYLGIGLVVVAAVFVFLRSGGIAPLSPLDSSTPVIAYALAGLSVVLLSTALILFKPRVPTLRPGQSVEQYWTRRTRQKGSCRSGSFWKPLARSPTSDTS